MNVVYFDEYVLTHTRSLGRSMRFLRIGRAYFVNSNVGSRVTRERGSRSTRWIYIVPRLLDARTVRVRGVICPLSGIQGVSHDFHAVSNLCASTVFCPPYCQTRWIN